MYLPVLMPRNLPYFSKLNKKLLKHNAPAEFAVIFADECDKAPSQ